MTVGFLNKNKVFLFAIIAILTMKRLVVAYETSSHHQQMIIEGPQDQQAKLGGQVVFKCRIRNLKGEPQWCIDDFCLGVSKKDAANVSIANQLTLKGRPRHRIIGDKSKGEFHLVIEPIQLQDNMFYYCMATAASETVKAVKSKKVFLTVLTYPQSLNLDNPVHVSLNKPSAIQCIARQSRPPVKILVAINGNLITDESKYRTEILQVPISMSQEDSIAASHINEHTNTDNSTNNKEQKIVNLTPANSITVEQMRESFYDTITSLSVDDISMKMNGQIVECFVHSFLNYVENQNEMKKFSGLNLNSFQNNMMNTKSIIQVDYAPEVTLKVLSASKILKEEDVISLICETKATPAIQIYKWYIGKNYLSGVGDSNLNLKLRREMHLKTVTCEASNTVASVKASIQLKILYKPSFTKGSKSFSLIDKNACNKPLTLDCQANSNPIANITWYRRRLNQNQIYPFVLDGRKLTSLFSKSESLNMISFDENKYYYDEMIGTGPTYTIASFDCANLFVNLRNRTSDSQKLNKPTKNLTEIKPKINQINQIQPRQFSLNRKANTTEPPNKLNVRNLSEQKINDNNDSTDEDEDLDYDLNGMNLNINDNINAEYDYASIEEDHDSYTISSTNYDYDNDFGIYFCEAINKFAIKSDQNDGYTARRYIKLNPLGPPVLKPMPSTILSTTSSNSDDIISELMKATEADQVEVATSIGSSVSLVCLVEPLPQFHSILWINENGRIIPNSKYSIHETTDAVSNSDASSVLNTQATPGQPSRSKQFRHFKIKYDNLTFYSSKTSSELNNDEEDSKIDPIVNEGLTEIGGDVSVMRSILFIKNVKQQDLGIYKCKASNEFGSHTVSILLREKTIIDKLNLNNSLFLTLSSSAMIILIIIIVLIVACMASRRVRRALCCCCCCCCFRCAKNILTDKDLLTKNLNCEQNSDKSINEWLVSSKLSNDTANGSLINSGVTNSNNMSTTTAISILNNTDLINDHIQSCNMSSLMNTLSKNLKSTKLHMNTPNHLRLDLNGASTLMHDDMDDDSDVEKNAHSRLFLTATTTSTETTGNTFKRDDNRSSSNSNTNNSMCYHQSSQFNRYLVSSPLLSTSSQKDSSEDSHDKSTDSSRDTNQTTPSPSSASTQNTNLSKTSMMLIRSPHNFNAKISACAVDANKIEQQRLLSLQSSNNNNNNNNNSIKLNSFMFNRRNFDNSKQIGHDKTFEKDYYENTNMDDYSDNVDGNEDDLSKILQDTTFRLSDLFNELSPNLVVNKPNNNTSFMKTPNLSVKTNVKPNLMKQFPSLNSISPPPPPPPPPSLPPHQTSSTPSQSQITQTSRQALLQAISQSNNQSNFNKFPNPFATSTTCNNTQPSITSSNTSKFYTNFYCNPKLSNSVSLEKYENNSNERNLSNDTEIKPNNQQHFSKITTTSTSNGNKNYQTVI